MTTCVSRARASRESPRDWYDQFLRAAVCDVRSLWKYVDGSRRRDRTYYVGFRKRLYYVFERKIGTLIARRVCSGSSGDRAILSLESTATVQLNRKAERARLLTDAVKCVYNLSRGCGGDSGGYTRARKAYRTMCRTRKPSLTLDAAFETQRARPMWRRSRSWTGRIPPSG